MPQKSHLPNHLDSIRTKLRPKHQLLVLKCYPRLPKNSTADVKPNGSELSYLLYYASTRKSKLQKVGTFLEKKTASDVYKWQSARVSVTLQILTALLENKSIGSSAAFPLFAPFVLRILREILSNTNDVNLVEASLATWDVFCKHQDQATLAADHEYRELYHDVVGRYAAFARKEGSKSLGKSGQVAVQDAIRLRKAGLGAMKSVLVSDALASEAGRQLDVVIPAILGNMKGEDEIYLEHLVRLQQRTEADEKQKAFDRRQSMAVIRTSTGLTNEGEADPRQAAGTAQDADDLADEEVAVLASECLKATFATDNRPQIRTATSAVLKYLSSLHARPTTAQPERQGTNKDLVHDTWATKLFEMCTAWTAVQDRFILMVTTVETLVRVPLKESDLHQHLLYTALIDEVLRSDLNLIGLSVMDVLLSLIQQILRVLQLSGPRVAGRSSAAQLFSSDEEKQHPLSAQASEQPTSSMPSEARLRLTARLKNCIADLGTHVYYTDQITDMLAAILMRLKPNPTTTGQQNPLATAAAIEEPQSAVMETASNVSQSARQRSASASGSGFFSFDTARQIALEAVRDVLVVANHGEARRSIPTIQKSTPGGVADSRHKVPLAIWEGTQWLLRDPTPEVRKAYVDALTTWLRLETTKRDARIKEPKQKTPKKDSVVARRAVSNASRKGREGVIEGQGKKVTNTFLSLLHLAVYENALQFASAASPEGEKEIALLHLLLTTFTQKLGVNAVQSGLPMIFALQDEVSQAQRVDQKVRLGSLVLGYFWGVEEKFELDVTAAGREVFTEITRRRAESIWLKEIGVPAAELKQISEFVSFTPTTANDSTEFKPLSSRQTLVDLIADAYATALIASPPASAPGSPGRSFTSPAPDRSGTNSYLNAKQPPNPSIGGPTTLPDKVKQAMLEPWTKDSCIAAIAANAPKSVSLSGSRSSPGHGAQQLAVGAGAGNHRQLLAAVANTPGASRNHSAQRRQQEAAGVARYRSPDRSGHRPSGSTPSGRARTSSSARKGTVRVEDLKRILNGEGPTVPISFGTRSVGDETASESLVDDEGFEEGRSDAGEGGFSTPPRGQAKNGSTIAEEAGPPVLNVPLETMMGREMVRNNGHESVSNGEIQQSQPPQPPQMPQMPQPPPSRGGASMRSARSTKTRAERKKDVLALLDGIKIDEKGPAETGMGGGGEKEDVLAGIKAPPY